MYKMAASELITSIRPAHEVNLETKSVEGKCIAIVGGGMTAANLALGAIAKGTDVVRPWFLELDCTHKI